MKAAARGEVRHGRAEGLACVSFTSAKWGEKGHWALLHRQIERVVIMAPQRQKKELEVDLEESSEEEDQNSEGADEEEEELAENG